MTAEEWDRETLDRMLIAQIGWNEPGLARKRRLYLSAVCRRFWEHLPTAESRRAVEATELYVEGALSLEELRAVHEAQLNAHVALCATGKRVARTRGFQLSACALNACHPDHCYLTLVSNAAASRFSVQVIRDLFANPFRPIAFDPRWRSSDAIALAQAIYDERAFGRLPILADSLMDAGCEEDSMLAHCRTGGPHFRGCWVVDLVLGKE